MMAIYPPEKNTQSNDGKILTGRKYRVNDGIKPTERYTESMMAKYP